MQGAESDSLIEQTAQDGAGEQAVSNSLRWGVIFLCALVCLLDGYDVLVAPVSVPVIAGEWGVESASFTVALTATVFGMALGAVFLAPLGDRFGRRSVITVSFGFVGLGSLLTPYFSSTVIDLAFFRFITGLAMGASLANSLALVSEVALPKFRSRVTVCVYSMSALGSVFGGMVVPGILSSMGWQGLYVMGGIIPLLLVPILFICIPGPARMARMLGVDSSKEVMSSSSHKPSVFKNLQLLLSTPYRLRTLVLWSLYFICLFTMYMMSTWLPTLIHLYGWSLDVSVLSLMVFSLGGIVGGFLIGWLADNGRTALAMSLGFSCAGIAMLSIKLVPAEVWIWMLLIALIGAGIIGVSYVIAALAAIVYPANLRAGGIGAASAMGRFGATLAPIFGGWLIAGGVTAIQVITGLVWPALIGLTIVFVFSKLLNDNAV